MRVLGFCVHILTATGAALALLALLAATHADWPLMFLLLGAALIVDAVDGPLARRFKIKDLLPRWSGDVLDLVVDFTTYVIVPAYAVATAGLLPEPLAVAAGTVIAVTGALYFADRDMKTPDNHFQGFPAVWNLVVFYLLLLRPAPWVVAGLVMLFAVLTFMPIRFVHPLRVTRLRPLTIAMLVLWTALALIAVWQGLAPLHWTTVGLCVIAMYFLAVGLLPARRSPT